MSYNLTDNVNDNFEVRIRENTYLIRYPTTGEIEELQSFYDEAKLLESKGEIEKARESAQKAEDFIYGLAEAQGDAPQIKEALKHENVQVSKKFVETLRLELGA